MTSQTALAAVQLPAAAMQPSMPKSIRPWQAEVETPVEATRGSHDAAHCSDAARSAKNTATQRAEAMPRELLTSTRR